ncbi:MAG: hypothetical protein IJ728_03875 [Selenomonadaceae bacterium]|nr:hypothetical protein [Selenomonadaceae bacterium]
MATSTENVLYINYAKGDDTLAVEFFDAVTTLNASFIENTFKPAAIPVLGLDSIVSSYYINTRQRDVT